MCLKEVSVAKRRFFLTNQNQVFYNVTVEYVTSGETVMEDINILIFWQHNTSGSAIDKMSNEVNEIRKKADYHLVQKAQLYLPTMLPFPAMLDLWTWPPDIPVMMASDSFGHE